MASKPNISIPLSGGKNVDVQASDYTLRFITTIKANGKEDTVKTREINAASLSLSGACEKLVSRNGSVDGYQSAVSSLVKQLTDLITKKVIELDTVLVITEGQWISSEEEKEGKKVTVFSYNPLRDVSTTCQSWVVEENHAKVFAFHKFSERKETAKATDKAVDVAALFA